MFKKRIVCLKKELFKKRKSLKKKKVCLKKNKCARKKSIKKKMEMKREEIEMNRANEQIVNCGFGYEKFKRHYNFVYSAFIISKSHLGWLFEFNGFNDFYYLCHHNINLANSKEGTYTERVNDIIYDAVVLVKNEEVPFDFEIKINKVDLLVYIKEEKECILGENTKGIENVIDIRQVRETDLLMMLIRKELAEKRIIRIPRFIMIMILRFAKTGLIINHSPFWKLKRKKKN